MIMKAITLILAAAIYTASCDSGSQQERFDKPQKAEAQATSANSRPVAKVVKIPVYLWKCRHCGGQVEGTSTPSAYHSWGKKSRVD